MRMCKFFGSFKSRKEKSLKFNPLKQNDGWEGYDLSAVSRKWNAPGTRAGQSLLNGSRCQSQRSGPRELHGNMHVMEKWSINIDWLHASVIMVYLLLNGPVFVCSLAQSYRIFDVSNEVVIAP